MSKMPKTFEELTAEEKEAVVKMWAARKLNREGHCESCNGSGVTDCPCCDGEGVIDCSDCGSTGWDLDKLEGYCIEAQQLDPLLRVHIGSRQEADQLYRKWKGRWPGEEKQIVTG